MLDQAMQAYIDATERCLAQCRGILEQEREKRKALLGCDASQMEAMLQAQQAAVMQLDSVEARRIDAQREAGLGDMTAEQILAQLPAGEARDALAPLYAALKETAEELQALNHAALEIANTQLRLLEQMENRQKAQKPAPASGVYRPGQIGRRDLPGGPGFEQKI